MVSPASAGTSSTADASHSYALDAARPWTWIILAYATFYPMYLHPVTYLTTPTPVSSRRNCDNLDRSFTNHKEASKCPLNMERKAFADSLAQALNCVTDRSISPDSDLSPETPPDTKMVFAKLGRIVRVLSPRPTPNQKSSVSNKIFKAPRLSKHPTLAKNPLQQPPRYAFRQRNKRETLRAKDTVWEGRLRSRASHRGARHPTAAGPNVRATK